MEKCLQMEDLFPLWKLRGRLKVSVNKDPDGILVLLFDVPPVWKLLTSIAFYFILKWKFKSGNWLAVRNKMYYEVE